MTDGPTTPTSGTLRLLRAALVAGVVVALAGWAHALGGGKLPSAGVLVALGAMVLAGATALTGRRVRPWTAVLALAGAQLGLHAAFTLVAGAGCGSLVATGTHAGHADHVAYLVAHGCAGAAAHMTLVPALGAWAMTVAHAAATVACALAIAAVDRVLLTVVGVLRASTTPALPVLAVAPRLPVVGLDVPALDLPWTTTAPRRGPPADGATAPPTA
ncbi:hypothetical protein [Cellulomonas sp. HZM]|uniref:hypothetical protein n=1 Tax=Cellulomonas sp. HZM TaxID=1454010 RepID=UPI000B09376D|nr:hypothetical protein [Cellulomonas sp. HZM]